MIQDLGDNLIPIIGIVAFFSCFVFWIIAETVDGMYKAKLSARLKEKLIERGDTAEQIDRIIRAEASAEFANQQLLPTTPVKPVKPASMYPTH